MKLKNNALQELYDTLVSGNPIFSPYAESPIDKAFRECDEKIQKDIDILKRSNETFLSANLDLASNKRKLEKERDNLLSRTHYAEDELERLRKAHDELFDAGSRKISEVRRENEAVNKKLEKDLADAKVRLHFLTHSRDDWKRRVEHAEDEVEALNKDNEDLGKRLMETTEAFDKVNSDRTELQKDRDYYYELYTKLRKDYDKLFEDNKNLKARTDCLRYEVEWYRKHYKEQSDNIKELKKKLDELTSQYQKLTIENKRLQNNVRAGYEQGQTDLWDMLQNVNDSQPYDFDVECETLGDVIDMDLEDFLDAYKKWYKKWQEEKETDRMRKWLTDFCDGRWCKECPLESSEYKCGMGYTFMGVNPIPDKDIKRYYEKARGCGRYTLKDDPCSGVREKIKDACDAFYDELKAGLASEVKEVPVSFNIPIKDPTSRECTFEAKVEINKDLLNKVCGIKPEEEEHKLEYGDAVRLPWCDYDYMYIGPDKLGDGKMIRLFDPKHHSVAYVSSNEHLDIRGYKIIIGNEEDLRKIWCDKDADKE